MDDSVVVELQLDRPARSAVVVEARCHLGLPVVVDVPPILDDGTPFPTTHWLTCPLANIRIARLEADGGVKAADRDIADDPSLRASWEVSMARYQRERDLRLPDDWDGPRPSGGIAGSRHGVKCLHAQYGDTAAGNDNPIGTRVAESIEPLDCLVPCVATVDGVPARNRDWSEPR